ncbi:MAG: hypothetical protein LBV45_02015 [Xanthomonadaceae bacterium]|nr:hypothetical protein [Xanthomonadaceae bacterium]
MSAGRYGVAQAAITTLPLLGYWRAQRAACSGVLAGRQGTGKAEFGGLTR